MFRSRPSLLAALAAAILLSLAPGRGSATPPGTDPAANARAGTLAANGEESASAATRPAGARIAFVRDTGSAGFELFTVRPDGSSLKRLTRNEFDEWGPAWSPDGTKIAFSSTRDGNSEIYVMSRAGTDVARLTFDEASDGVPAWSPNGRWIAFSSNRRNGVTDDLFVMRSDGGRATRLTRAPGNEWNASWAPGGRRLVFERDDSIYTIRRDGTGLRRLTRGLVASNPDWSPDGRHIAFQADFADSTWMDLYVVRPNGSDARAILATRKDEQSPSWSPDGRRIAYTSDHRVAIARADGSRRRVLFSHDMADYAVDWGRPVLAGDQTGARR